MRHWRPDTSAAVPREQQRRRKRDWTSLEAYAPPRARPRHHGEMRTGARVGLIVIALACAAAALGAAMVLGGPDDPIDELAVDP